MTTTPTHADLQSAALSAMRAAGFPFDQLEPDEGFKRPQQAALDHFWYKANTGTGPTGKPYFQVSAGDAREAGGVDTATFTWSSWKDHEGARLAADEVAEVRAQIEAKTRDAKARRTREQAQARTKAATDWEAATADGAETHPYLVRKGVGAHGVKVSGDTLLIPVRDAEGTLHGLQRIAPDGDKRFTKGTAATGHFHLIGEPTPGGRLYLCEGYATGASVHEAKEAPTACAFNCGNLPHVVKVLRGAYPAAVLIVAGDDDTHREGNPGRTHAEAAARSVGAPVVFPVFADGSRPDGRDWNDLTMLEGIEAVRVQLEAPQDQEPAPYAETEVSEVSGVQASNGAGFSDTPDGYQEVSGVSDTPKSPIPEPPDRPCWRVFDDWLEHGGERYRPGVWHFGTDSDGNDTKAWICSPLHLAAVTFDGQDNNFGRLLRFKNTLNRWREWAMPMELLSGMGNEIRAELLAMGVEIDPSTKARNLLATYLQDRPPKRRMRCALQVGWCGGSFVLPSVVIGPDASGVIFQSGERGHDEHTKGGTLDGWREGIAARAVGNPVLTMAVSGSFVGPLLSLCNAESGGIHWHGDSSIGKTAILEGACATWGGPGYRRSWRATANGMEGAAALFNDCLLALDEISECDPREVGGIVYALGNGRGKQRASRTGAARGVTRWRCFIVSSGERTIATTMQEGGFRAKAGQGVRLLDIPAARTFGAWDDLQGLASGAALSDAIKRTAATHHGHAGQAFLERLTRDKRDFCALLERFKALPDFAADDGEGQDKRAAGRFALLAMAGELATEYQVTGWPEGEAIRAAAVGFVSWQAARGKGNTERRQILERVAGFIERHGDARFSDADASGDGAVVRDRAGWWTDNDGRVYLFTGEGMRETLKGFDFGRALDVLQAAGVLPAPGSDGKRAQFKRIAGRGMKLYHVKADALGGDHGA
ncbi:DUF927 domain-containing protein [uncultured Thiodictyon sp.]|uniref:DUF927 domain-containing protein n=1 Tax=uncultured Thiodictyon sp. TaxID=1846217 RepID=UPI0025F5B5F9|nr:DUF927 domain-containing protein [uncultured Thiodictyon sp.]